LLVKETVFTLSIRLGLAVVLRLGLAVVLRLGLAVVLRLGRRLAKCQPVWPSSGPAHQGTYSRSLSGA
jgi:hypothetical protein